MRSTQYLQNHLEPINWDILYETQRPKIKQRIAKLQNFINRSDVRQFQLKDIKQTMDQFIKYTAKYTSQIRFMEQNQILSQKNIRSKKQKKIEKTLLSEYRDFNLFNWEISQRQTKHWELVISEQAACQINKIINEEQQILSFLTKISLYTRGFIPIQSKINNSKKYLVELKKSQESSSRYFFDYYDEFNIIMSIGIQKIPKFKNFKTMEYNSYIEILKISEQIIQKPLKNYTFINECISQQQYYNWLNPSKNFIKNQNQEYYLRNRTTQIFDYQQINPQEERNVVKRQPFFSKEKINQKQQLQEYIQSLKNFDYHKTIYLQQIKIQESQQERKYKLNQIKKIKKQFQINQQRQKNLKNIYKSIPQSLFNLSDEQIKIVHKSNSFYVVSRSGTGKTKTFLIKLFCLQYLFKHLSMKNINKSQLELQFQRENYISDEKIEMNMELLNKKSTMKNLFLTISPQLINLTKKQYNKISENVKIEILQRRRQQQNQMNQLQIVDIQLNNDLEQLRQKLKKQQQKKEEFEEFYKLQNYPAFLDIKHLLLMWNKSLRNPLIFSSKKQQQNLNLQKQGNQKEKISTQSLNAPQKINVIQSEDQDSEQQIRLEFGDQIQIQEQRTSKEKKKSRKEKKKQLTFDIFLNEFWPNIHLYNQSIQLKKIKNFEASNIWYEIISIIKGSYRSHKSHKKYLSRKQYYKSSKIRQFKQVVYSIFISYEQFKVNNRYYDIMDLVNHILAEIDFYGYQGQPINFLFIDEVQDLPPAMLYLLSKPVVNGLYFCGDSAQTIAKGVSFKFSDINELFNEKNLSPYNHDKLLPICNFLKPDKLSLNINYRSHNQILQLANSIVQLIDNLFKGYIDRMQPELTHFRGNIPLLMDGKNLQQSEIKFFEMLVEQQPNNPLKDDQKKQFDREVQDKKFYQLKPSQIVLIRNEEQRTTLPYRLRRQTVLTLLQVKGLQYDDVVMYNFFSNVFRKVQLIKKWNTILSYIQIKQSYPTIQQYQKKYKQPSKRDFTKHHLYGDQNEFSIYNWDQLASPKIFQEDETRFIVPLIGLDDKKNIKLLRQEEIDNYYEILTELKVLYTAVTRAKKTFIFFQNDINNIPSKLLDIWKKTNNIRIVTDQNYFQYRQRVFQYRKSHNNTTFENQREDNVRQGIKWQEKQNYRMAMTYFKKVDDRRHLTRMQAKLKAKEACQQIKKLSILIKDKKKMSKKQYTLKKRRYLQKKRKLYPELLSAAVLFHSVNQFVLSGKCYYEADAIKEALQQFKLALQLLKPQTDEYFDCLKNCAICSKMIKDYQNAGYYYKLTKNFLKMLECYQKLQNKSILLSELKGSQSLLSQQNVSVIKKYCQMYLDWVIKNQLSNENTNQIRRYKNINQVFFQPISSNQRNRKNQQNIYRSNYKQIKYFYEKLVKNKDQLIQKVQDIKSIQIQMKQIEQSITMIDQDFQTQNSQYQISQIQKLYQTRQHTAQESKRKKDNNFITQCKIIGIKQQNAIQLIKKYKIYITQKRILQESLLNLKQVYKLQCQKFQQFNKADQKIQQISKRIPIWQKSCNQLRQMIVGYDAQQKNKLIINIYQFQSQIRNQSQMLFYDKNAKRKCMKIFNSKFTNQELNRLIKQQMQLFKQIQPVHLSFVNVSNQTLHHWEPYNKLINSIIYHLPKIAQYLPFLKATQKYQQNHLAILACEHIGLYDLSKRFILSEITKLNSTFSKERLVTQLPFFKENDKNMNLDIDKFLGTINSQILSKLSKCCIYFQQKIVNSIVECLLIQGFYRNAKYYLTKKSQKCQLAYILMDHKELQQCESGSLIRSFRVNRNYIFLDQNRYQKTDQRPKKVNSLSMQDVFFLIDSTKQKPYLQKIDWVKGVQFSAEIMIQMDQKVQSLICKQLEKLQFLKVDIQNKNNRLYITFQQQKTLKRSRRQEVINNCKLQLELIKQRCNALVNQIKEIMILKARQCQEQRIMMNDRDQHMKLLKQLYNQLNQLKNTKKLIQNEIEQNGLERQLQFEGYWNAMKIANQMYQGLEQLQMPKFLCKQIVINMRIEQLQILQFNMQYQIQIKKQQLKSIRAKIQIITAKQIQLHNQFSQHDIRTKKLDNQIIQQTHLEYNLFQEEARLKNQLSKLMQQVKNCQRRMAIIEQHAQRAVLNQYLILYADKQLQNHKLKVIDKITNSNSLTSPNNQGYFQLIIQFCKDKISPTFFQILNHNQWTKNLANTLKGALQQFSQLTHFKLCEIIILYLSLILYPEQQSIQKILLYRSQKNLQDKLFQKQKQKNSKWQQYLNLFAKPQKRKWEIDCMNGLYIQIQNLSKDIQILYCVSPAFIETRQKLTIQYQLKAMIKKIVKQTTKVTDKNFIFIQLLMGFFQCRVIERSDIMFFLDKEYALVKSSSIIVEQVLSDQIYKNSFIVYYDQNKEFVLMKFQTAFRVVKYLLGKQLKRFLQFNKMNDLLYLTQNDSYQYNIFQRPDRTDQDGLAYQREITSQSEQKVNFYYTKFTNYTFQKQISQQKQIILRFYYGNGFKTTEMYHFLIHQLKILQRLKEACQMYQAFNIQIMKDIEVQFEALKKQYQKWKDFLVQENLISRERFEN